jgi:hypothetical protein
MTKRTKPSFRAAQHRMAAIAAVLAVAILGIAGTASAQVIGLGGASMTGWTPNNNVGANPGSAGLPSVAGTGTLGDVLTLTNNNNGIATSYWFNTPQNITNFTESFVYTQTTNTPGNGADGIAIAWQNAGTTALGGGGGDKGFAGITTAAAMGLNIYGGNSGSGSQFNNATPSGNGLATTPTPGGVDITSGHGIQVTFSYRQSDNALTETMTDTTNPSNTFTRVWRGVDIQGQVGGTTARIGFTGGTGGINATQTITNFQFTPGAAGTTPVAKITPIAATGYNQNMVISAANGGANVTATMDDGTGKGGDTFYETGLAGTPNVSGVPKAGVVFGSGNDTNHTFVLQANGPGQNDAVMLDETHTAGTLSLSSPARYSVLSFLLAGGNGGAPIGVTIHYAGGGMQTGMLTSPDWFGNGALALAANGRDSVALNDLNAVNSGNPRLFQQDVMLADTLDNVLSVDFAWQGTIANGDHNGIFAISGQAIPEPSSLALLSLGAVGFLVRRLRSRQRS